MTSHHSVRERGQVVVVFALLVPMILAMGAAVIGIGNWYTHAKHLQTKADAGAFAGGGVWAFPCVEDGTQGPTSTQQIIDAARLYIGQHVQADGMPYNTTTFNPQVGNVPGSAIHAVLNGSAYYDDDSNAAPIERDSPPNQSICDAKVLDVKLTEDNSFPLFSLVPLFPDIKRKARVQIEQIEGLNGLLPIAVRVPKPLSAAAVFYNESNGNLLAVKYMCESTVGNLPAGLGGWSTIKAGLPANPLCTSWANFNVGAGAGTTIGVAIATSVRPACDTPNPPPGGWGLCMDDNPAGVTTADQFCRQASGLVKCFYSTGSGNGQTVQSGLQYIRGFSPASVTNGPPELQDVWLDTPSAGCGSYFSVTSTTCSAQLHAAVSIGNAPGRSTANTDVKYGVVYGTTVRTGTDCLDSANRPNCDMNPSWTANVTFDPRFDNQGDIQAARHAIAIRVRLKNTTVANPSGPPTVCGNNYSATCQWFFTAAGPATNWPNNNATLDNVFNNPVQRAFTGDDAVSGPIKFVQLTSATGGGCTPQYVDGQAASQPAGQHCFMLEMGLKGALATDQDEPPFGFNFKGSQSGSVDCDDGWPNWRTEVEESCRPFYAANDFSVLPPNGPCPWPPGQQVSWNTFMNPPSLPGAPYDTQWPPYTCLRTDGPPAQGQVENGLKARIFNGNAGQNTCPTDSATTFVPGRNYWDDDNNTSGGLFAFADLGVHPNNLRPQTEDKRLVTLFLTAYDSFGGSGGDVFPIVGFANFYITGFGKRVGQGFQVQDPCPGSTRPADLLIVPGADYIWGHFVNAVTPGPFTTGGNGVLCQPLTSFQPCVATLVE